MTSYWLARVVEVLMIAALIGVVAMVALQVFYRYVLESPLHYTEELARYFTIWAALLGASLGVRSGTHFSVTFFIGLLGKSVRRIVVGAANFAIAIFIAAFLITSVDLMQVAAVQESSGARIPLVLVYGSMPVGAALMLIFIVTGAIAGVIDELPSETEPLEPH
jgi:TRAP-type C4-dicarboxylate transport system permease small subunit